MRPNRQHRRRYGTSDEADAIGAARGVLSGEAIGTPKSQTGQVEAIRLVRVARRSAMKARTQAGNQIHAVVDTAFEQLRRHFVRTPTTAIVAEAARFRRRHRPDTPLEAARLALRTLARRWECLNDELVELDAQLDDLTAQVAPTLRAINGVGAQVATALLAAAGDNPERLRSSSSLPRCAVSHRSTPHPAASNITDSTATATARPTGRCTSSSPADSAGTRQPRPTWPADSARDAHPR